MVEVGETYFSESKRKREKASSGMESLSLHFLSACACTRVFFPFAIFEVCKGLEVGGTSTGQIHKFFSLLAPISFCGVGWDTEQAGGGRWAASRTNP